MPVHTTRTEAGHPAKQWGEHGHPYPYSPGNPASEAAATNKAAAQGRAAHAHGFQEDEASPPQGSGMPGWEQPFREPGTGVQPSFTTDDLQTG